MAVEQHSHTRKANNGTLVTIILPAYNEASILERNVTEIYNHIKILPGGYNWEIIIINDGSTDGTGKIADDLAAGIPVLRVIHHHVNLNLGNAMSTGFRNAKGKYIISLDIDLSYSVDHIEKMLDILVSAKADLVLASPYMKGGRVTSVPFLRRIMSKWVNWLMSHSSQEKYHTFTSMARAYRGDFIRTLNLKTNDYEIFPEIIYKAMILRARIVEIPAHLDWSLQKCYGQKRTSGIRIMKSVFHSLMAAFILRPYVYFFTSGLIVMIIFLIILVDILKEVYIEMNNHSDIDMVSAVAQVFNMKAYEFLIGGFLFTISLQILIQGFASLQKKRYYEELFHINTTLLKKLDKILINQTPNTDT